jgi:hypothetical protein
MFKMKPQRGTLWLAVVIFMLGILSFFDGHKDPGDIAAQDRSNLVLAIAVVVSGVLIIISTSRMWFKHLWHDRYERKGRSSRHGRR